MILFIHIRKEVYLSAVHKVIFILYVFHLTHFLMITQEKIKSRKEKNAKYGRSSDDIITLWQYLSLVMFLYSHHTVSLTLILF